MYIHPELLKLVLRPEKLGPGTIKKVAAGHCEMPWQEFMDRVAQKVRAVAWQSDYHKANVNEPIHLGTDTVDDFFSCSLREGAIMDVTMMNKEINCDRSLCDGCYRARINNAGYPWCVGYILKMAWKRRQKKR